MSARIIVVDDEETIREELSEFLAENGFHVETASDGQEALERIMEDNFDIAICDVRMPNMDGMELLERIKQVRPQTSVIMITAYGTVETAVEAMKMGAYDYILKPLILEGILIRIRHLLEYRDLNETSLILRREIEKKYDFENIIGKSPEMVKIYELIRKVADTPVNILITGESGTGKELIARAIHYNSSAKNKRFIPINCGAIPETLLESELFGHKKGSFTGATHDKDGLFIVAKGGTVFLDEIGEIPLGLQVKLLRATERREIIPIGATKPTEIDVRIIAATNKDLKQQVKEGKFREDLLYRLNVVEIHLPPLRERREDIPLLVNHFIAKYSRELKKNVKGVDNETMKILMEYEWKGNVRELENVIERALILGEGEYITPADLPPDLFRVEPSEVEIDNLKEAVRKFEKRHIKSVLQRFNNDKRAAAKALGLSLSSLYRKLEEPA